jgi:hypothetical protein
MEMQSLEEIRKEKLVAQCWTHDQATGSAAFLFFSCTYKGSLINSMPKEKESNHRQTT